MEINTHSLRYYFIKWICDLMNWTQPTDKCDLYLIYRKTFAILLGSLYLSFTLIYYATINDWSPGFFFQPLDFHSIIAMIIIWAVICIVGVIIFLFVMYCIIMPLWVGVEITFFNSYPEFTPKWLQNIMDKIECEKITYNKNL